MKLPSCIFDGPCLVRTGLAVGLLSVKKVRSYCQISIFTKKILALDKTNTGGPPLTRKSVTRFPLPRFLAYVRASRGLSVSLGPPQYSPTNTNFM